MTKHGLRGVMLGVSLALLLAGGVALAQGLTVTVDKDCVECYPLEEINGVPIEDYIATIMTAGWDYDLVLCSRVYHNGEPHGDLICEVIPAIADPLTSAFILPCELPEQLEGLAEQIVNPAQYDVADYYGEWKYCFWQPDTGEIACAIWLFAEVCEEEFVPEAGTIALLGSGLAGLAGYATLRLRTRG